MNFDLLKRPRRGRLSAGMRSLVREHSVGVGDLVWPVFVHAGNCDQEVASMPGVVRHSVTSLVEACVEASDLGILAVAVFPVIEDHLKDEVGSCGFVEDGVLYQAVREIKARCRDLIVITDVALDPYTNHGHDGLLSANKDVVENDSTVAALVKLAVLEAQAGADVVAPSDMMDGRVRAIRQGLDAEGFEHVAILSYAAKYASALYGPFRDAVGSKIGSGGISKATYQMDPANVREALREVRLDEEEGADIVMVKPAGMYLDVIRAIRSVTDLPLAAYQVSGEYAQIHAAARLGWLNYRTTRDESLCAIKRAGADFIFTYFAQEVAREIRYGTAEGVNEK